MEIWIDLYISSESTAGSILQVVTHEIAVHVLDLVRFIKDYYAGKNASIEGAELQHFKYAHETHQNYDSLKQLIVRLLKDSKDFEDREILDKMDYKRKTKNIAKQNDEYIDTKEADKELIDVYNWHSDRIKKSDDSAKKTLFQISEELGLNETKDQVNSRLPKKELLRKIGIAIYNFLFKSKKNRGKG